MEKNWESRDYSIYSITNNFNNQYIVLLQKKLYDMFIMQIVFPLNKFHSLQKCQYYRLSKYQANFNMMQATHISLQQSSQIIISSCTTSLAFLETKKLSLVRMMENEEGHITKSMLKVYYRWFVYSHEVPQGYQSCSLGRKRKETLCRHDASRRSKEKRRETPLSRRKEPFSLVCVFCERANSVTHTYPWMCVSLCYIATRLPERNGLSPISS